MTTTFPLRLKKIIGLCLLFICVSCFKSSAQSDLTLLKIDSIKQVIASSTNDTIHGTALNSLALLYQLEVSGGIDSVLHYANRGKKWGEQKNILKVQAKSLDILGAVWRDKLDKNKSVKSYESAHKLFLAIGDTITAIKMKGNIATSLISFGEIEEAVKIKLENIEAFAEMNDSTALMVEYYGIGYAYSSTQLHEKALLYFLKAAKYKDHPLVLGTIGRHYSNMGKMDSAYLYLEQGLNIANPGSGFETDLFQKLGSVYFDDKKYPESIKQYQRALKNLGLDSKTDLASRVRTNLTNAYIENGEITAARKLFNKIDHKEDNKIKNARYYEIKFRLLQAEGRFKDAFNAHIDFKEASDSLANTDLKSRIEEIETKYETEKKDNEITNLETQDQLNKQLLSRQRMMIIGAGLGLLLFFFLTFFLYRLYQKVTAQKNIISKALSEKDLLLREIHHRVKNNLQLVSSLLTLQGDSITDETAQQAINDGQNRVKSMALIHQDLYNKENLTGINVKTYIEKLTQELFLTYKIDTAKINLQTEIEDLELDVDTLIPMGLILNELITNSLKYAFPNDQAGQLYVSLKEVQNQLVLKVKDNGIGYDPKDIRENSFGATLISSLTAQLDGEIDTRSDDGTEVTIKISADKL